MTADGKIESDLSHILEMLLYGAPCYDMADALERRHAEIDASAFLWPLKYVHRSFVDIALLQACKLFEPASKKNRIVSIPAVLSRLKHAEPRPAKLYEWVIRTELQQAGKHDVAPREEEIRAMKDRQIADLVIAHFQEVTTNEEVNAALCRVRAARHTYIAHSEKRSSWYRAMTLSCCSTWPRGSAMSCSRCLSVSPTARRHGSASETLGALHHLGCSNDGPA